MIGPLNFSQNPSEEELLCGLQDGSVLCNLLNKVAPDALSFQVFFAIPLVTHIMFGFMAQHFKEKVCFATPLMHDL